MKLFYSLSKEQKPREIRALLNLFKNELKDVGIIDYNQNIIGISKSKNNIPKEYTNAISTRIQYTHLQCKISNNEKEFYIEVPQDMFKLIRIGINININLLSNFPENQSFTSDKHGLCLIGNTLYLMPQANETYIIRNSKLYYSKNKKYIFLHPENNIPIFIYSIPL
jgi:hypothetical protein